MRQRLKELEEEAKKDSGKTAERDQARTDFLDAKLYLADIVYEIGKTYEPGSEQFKKQLAEAAAHQGPLILLDQVTDPHNVGAILRSAAAFGAAGVVTTRRHSPPLNGTLAKSASGALEIIPIALVQNLARAITELREAGVVILGLDSTATGGIEDEPFDRATAIILGAEGKGLRQLTAESCHRLVRITTADNLRSLNVSNAAAVALHTALIRRRGGA